MAVNYDRQYRTLSNAEFRRVGYGLPMTVRLRELAWSINNFKARVAPCMLIPCQRFWAGHMSALEGSTSERVIHMFAPVVVPHGYDRFTWSVGSYLVSAGSTRLRLYSSPRKYDGPTTFDHDAFGVAATHSEVWITSATHSFQTATDGRVSKDMVTGQTWLTLTAQNTDSGLGNYCLIQSISAAAYVVL